mmetsp:Transcript_31559/g.82490  ORF Transcript_31559/g.82490 Transcript_31559/m.82490 type:complete len:205 (-) Transcript_31559:17-631(-)
MTRIIVPRPSIRTVRDSGSCQAIQDTSLRARKSTEPHSMAHRKARHIMAPTTRQTSTTPQVRRTKRPSARKCWRTAAVRSASHSLHCGAQMNEQAHTLHIFFRQSICKNTARARMDGGQSVVASGCRLCIVSLRAAGRSLYVSVWSVLRVVRCIARLHHTRLHHESDAGMSWYGVSNVTRGLTVVYFCFACVSALVQLLAVSQG